MQCLLGCVAKPGVICLQLSAALGGALQTLQDQLHVLEILDSGPAASWPGVGQVCHPLLAAQHLNILPLICCCDSFACAQESLHCDPWHAALRLALAGRAAMQTLASCSCPIPHLTLQALKDVAALARMVAEGASLAEREAASEAEQRRAAAEHAQAASDRAAACEQAQTVSKARATKLQQELQAKQQVRFARMPGAAAGPIPLR